MKPPRVRIYTPSLWGVVCWICLTTIASAAASYHQKGDGYSKKHRNDMPDEGSRHNGLNRSIRATGNKIIVSTILEPPYMMLKEQAMGSFLAGNNRFEGYMADALSHLSVALGFDYAIRLSLDGNYGSVGPDGNWNGMVGELQRGEADMAVGPMTVTADRAAVVDFTEPFMAFRTTALLKRPSHSHGDQTGNPDIETAEDLVQSNVIYGLQRGTITEQLMQTAEEPFYRSMWSRMVNFWPVAFVRSPVEGVERARRENYAFLLDTPMAEYKQGQPPCDLYSVEPFLSRRHYAIAIRKGDRLKGVINAEIRNMRRNQILQSLYLKWWASSCSPHISPYSSERDAWQEQGEGGPTSPRPGRGQATSAHRSASGSIHHGPTVRFQLTGFTLALCCYVLVCRFVPHSLVHCL